MKVLLVHHNFLPYARAGSEIYTYYLAKELQRQGVQVQVLFAKQSAERLVERSMYDGIACTILHRPLNGYRNLFWEEDQWTDAMFANVLRQFGPDVVHINHLLQLSTNMPRIAKLHGKPVLFTLHDYWLRCPRFTLLDSDEKHCEFATTSKCTRCCRELYSKFPLYRSRAGHLQLIDHGKSLMKIGLSAATEVLPAYWRMQRRDQGMRALLEYVDVWIAPSRFLRDSMVQWGVPQEKLFFFRYGMNKGVFDKVKTVRKSNGHLQFGYVGTISRHKGVHLLLEAFRGLKDVDLSIYGNRAAQIFLQYSDVVAQDNIHIKGVLTDADKARAFEALDALIVPSIWFENSPLVIQEAFLAGVPVICSDIGGMRELVRHGQDGLHFRTGSAVELRRVIEACVQNPSRLRDLKPSAEGVLGTEEHVRSQLVPLYDRLVQSSGHGAGDAITA